MSFFSSSKDRPWVVRAKMLYLTPIWLICVVPYCLYIGVLEAWDAACDIVPEGVVAIWEAIRSGKG